MIDLHTHILPAMDDGSANPEETAALLSLLQAQGVTMVVATPHFYAHRESPEQFLQRREQCFAKGDFSSMPVILGAEVAYFAGMGSCSALLPLQLGSNGLLLVEMPFTPWNDRIIRDICNIPGFLGLTPVLAHVDRYRKASQFPKYCQQLLENGVLFQCNADVFDTLSGRKWALEQLRRNCIHFLGSDCHNLTTRPPKMDMARQVIEKKLGKDFFEAFQSLGRSFF